VNKTVKLAVSVLICLAAGFIGSSFTTPSIATWYAQLQKPVFNPPNWIFAPVWTMLYLLMAIAAYLIWETGLVKKDARIALSIFALQLALNSLWSIIFFGWHSIPFAFVEILILWLAIVATIVLFNRISRTAAYLMAPYILWVSFAAVLNFSLMLLNR